jgi:hypothetical protein
MAIKYGTKGQKETKDSRVAIYEMHRRIQFITT